MLRAADAAMYQAKTSGEATCHSGDVTDTKARQQKPARRAAGPNLIGS
jgi:hypothetical protein